MRLDINGNGTLIDKEGTIRHYKNHQMHCDDGPAIIEKDGTKRFYKNGVRFKTVWEDGSIHEGLEDGSIYKAYCDDDGKLASESWWDEDGEYHRDGDLPACIEYVNGKPHSLEWFKHGERHRTNGLPATISSARPGVIMWGMSTNEYVHWYKDGKRIDIKPIIEHHQLDPDFTKWSDADLLIVRMAIS